MKRKLILIVTFMFLNLMGPWVHAGSGEWPKQASTIDEILQVAEQNKGFGKVEYRHLIYPGKGEFLVIWFDPNSGVNDIFIFVYALNKKSKIWLHWFDKAISNVNKFIVRFSTGGDFLRFEDYRPELHLLFEQSTRDIPQ